MTYEFVELSGKKNGPTSVVLGGVHGDERCGVDALKKNISNLQIDRGRVILGYGNPRSIENDVRFVDADLNRMFKQDDQLTGVEKRSYEYGRAQFLKTYLNKADALIDIHASITPDSTPFVICEPNAHPTAQFLPAELIVSGFDAIEPGGTDYYMNSIGKTGICIECGYRENPLSLKIAEESLFAFLKARGHIENDLKPRAQVHVQIYDLYITKTEEFRLAKSFGDFEDIRKDQSIGMDGTVLVQAQRESVILFARDRNKIGEEAFLLGEKRPKLLPTTLPNNCCRY
jgi:succinylglutamate desuccinylase